MQLVLVFRCTTPLFLHRVLLFFTAPATTDIYTLSLHDALPICRPAQRRAEVEESLEELAGLTAAAGRSEEHTSELQSLTNLVCRLLLEKKKKKANIIQIHRYEIRRTNS